MIIYLGAVSIFPGTGEMLCHICCRGKWNWFGYRVGGSYGLHSIPPVPGKIDTAAISSLNIPNVTLFVVND